MIFWLSRCASSCAQRSVIFTPAASPLFVNRESYEKRESTAVRITHNFVLVLSVARARLRSDTLMEVFEESIDSQSTSRFS